MLRKPPTTGETRHSVAEHHEIEEALNDLAATDMSEGGWLTKFKSFEHQYRHHIDEEEQDFFPKAKKLIPKEVADLMGERFDARKKVVLAAIAPLEESEFDTAA